MRFKYPQLLLLLVPIVVLLFYKIRKIYSGKAFPRLGVPTIKSWKVQSVFLMRGFSPRLVALISYVVASCFLVIALARPQTNYQKLKRNVEGIDILMVLDLSASMNIEDFGNQNRIDIAKLIMKEFIKGRSADKVGLEVFSGEAVTLVPPTLDQALVLQALDQAEIGDLKDGTAIGDALATAVGRMKESTAKSRIIILLTDGDSNVGQVDPSTGGEMAKSYGIKVYSIAIGRDGRVRMPFVTKDIFGRKHTTYQIFENSINPILLQEISKATGGKFYRVQDDPEVLKEVFQDIDKLEKTKIEESVETKYDEHFSKFAWLTLVFMLIGFFCENWILRVYP